MAHRETADKKTKVLQKICLEKIFTKNNGLEKNEAVQNSGN